MLGHLLGLCPVGERKPAKASMSRSSAPMLKIPCLKAH